MASEAQTESRFRLVSWMPKPFRLAWMLLALAQVGALLFYAVPLAGDVMRRNGVAGIPFWMDTDISSDAGRQLQFLCFLAICAGALVASRANVCINRTIVGRIGLTGGSVLFVVVLAFAAYLGFRDGVEHERAERNLRAGLFQTCWERSTLPNAVYQMRSDRKAVCLELREIERTYMLEKNWRWRARRASTADDA